MCVWRCCASGLCIRAKGKMAACVGDVFHATNMVKRACLFVCCFLRVCVQPSEKFMPGNWDIIGCVFVLGVRAHASKGTGCI